MNQRSKGNLARKTGRPGDPGDTNLWNPTSTMSSLCISLVPLMCSWIPAHSSHLNPFIYSFYNTSSFKFHAPFAPLQLDKTRESDSVDCKPQNKMSRRMSFAMAAFCSWPVNLHFGWDGCHIGGKHEARVTRSPLGDPGKFCDSKLTDAPWTICSLEEQIRLVFLSWAKPFASFQQSLHIYFHSWHLAFPAAARTFSHAGIQDSSPGVGLATPWTGNPVCLPLKGFLSWSILVYLCVVVTFSTPNEKWLPSVV